MVKISRVKIIFIFLAIILIVFGFGFLYYTWTNSAKVTSEHALLIAETSEIALNGEMLKQLRAVPEDIGTVAYESIKNRLMILPSIDKDIRFAYLYIQRDNKLYFIADSEQVNSKDYSPPGQEYIAGSNEFKKPFIDGKSLVAKPATDKWGTWVSVLVPVKDLETGEITAVFALDYPASNWNNEALKNTFQSGIVIFVLFLLLVAFYIVINGNKKVKEGEEKYRLLIENTSDIIFILSIDRVFTFVSPALFEILGYQVSEVIGQKIDKYIFPNDLEKFEQSLKQTFETGKRQEDIEYRIKNADGSWKWYSTSIVLYKDVTGSVIRLYGVTRDINKQKEALNQATQLNKYMAGREIKMIELKRRIKELENK